MSSTLEAPGSYVSQRDVAAEADRVFSALTTATGLTGWWTTQLEGSPTRGETVRLSFPNAAGQPLVIRVEEAAPVSEAQPVGQVVWVVCAAPQVSAWEEWDGTRMQWSIRPRSAGSTMVQFRHQGLSPRLRCYDQCSRGWDGVLDSFCRYVDAGEGNPFA